MRLLFDDCRREMLVGYVAGELVCGEVPLNKASTSQGMLGKLNVGVTNATTHETVAVSDATVIGEVLSTVYVASDMAAKFAVDKSTSSCHTPAPRSRCRTPVTCSIWTTATSRLVHWTTGP